MTVLDVHLTGLGQNGQSTGEVLAFWWNGAELKKMLQDNLSPVDPWPSWRGRVSSDSLKEFANAHQNVTQDRRDKLNDELNRLLAGAVEIEVLIQEA